MSVRFASLRLVVQERFSCVLCLGGDFRGFGGLKEVLGNLGVGFLVGGKMPEMVASYSSQRFSALLDFQRDVDLVCPSHLGKKNPSAVDEGFLLPHAKANHHRGRHGDTFWQDSWSDSLSALLSSSFQRAPSPPAAASPPRPCAVEAARRSSSFTTLTRSQGQFSPQKFIRNALKRAFARDEPSASVMMVKRARFEDFGSTAEPMVCG